MQTIRTKISKEMYDRLKDMPYREREDTLIKEGYITDAMRYGYGVYGHSVFKDEDGYILQLTIGDSCD